MLSKVLVRPDKVAQFPLWLIFILTTVSALIAAEWAARSRSPHITTGNPLDVAIAGPGFFQVQDKFERVLYTRDGSIEVDNNGQLVVGGLKEGCVLQPPITIPKDATEVIIQRNGKVSVRHRDHVEPIQLGQIQLATFTAVTGLAESPPDSGYYSETELSGSAQLGDPFPGTPGIILQGCLNNDSGYLMSYSNWGIELDHVTAVTCAAFLLLEMGRLRASIKRLDDLASALLDRLKT